ncbi:uncharacterized protein LOC125228243 [Leguminivora glycinivorella]|uniref:uncharacterized protein LOC125228243 n=1 Tax=Leguminivora glycinivorella TaxID=1035111 RepID=UPI00200F9723|nr:uncharacterized protein LOC125228243 [Leguminivora glycinivorella]
MEDTDAVTILDVLGVDLCARALFAYLPVIELVRTERVCRQWQRAVQIFLHSYHNDILYNVYHFYLKSFRDGANYGNRKVDQYFAHKSLFTACKTLEKFAGKISDDVFKNVSSKCPYLQHLIALSEGFNCKKLRISELIKHKRKNACSKPNLHLTSDILKHIKSKNLTLNILSTAMNSLRNITTLELDDHNVFTLDYMHLMLNAMPELETLYFCNYSCKYSSILYNSPCIVSTDELISSISQLVHLKCLYLRNNTIVNDTLLEELAQKCKELEYLDISYDNIYKNWPKKYSARGVAALCRRPFSVTTLCLGYVQNFTSISLVMYFRDLPIVHELEKLGCYVLTPQWLDTTLSSQTVHPLEVIVGSKGLNSCVSEKSDELYNLKIVLNTDVHTEREFVGKS